MKNLRKSLPFASFLLLIVVGACTATKFSSVWEDETYQGPPQKILVINTFHDPANRRIFEDDLVKSLKELGADAVASYTVMPAFDVSDKDAVALEANKLGADTVLINKPLGKRVDEFSGRSGHYADVLIDTQTDVYDMKTKRLIFNARAETWIREGDPYNIHIESYVDDLVQKLSRKGLFRKKDVSS